MTGFEYSLKVGEYISPVRVDISLKIDNGLDKDDYETIRIALNTIEEIAKKYEKNLL